MTKNKPGHARETEHTRISQYLQIIVMRLFDTVHSVPGIVLRKRGPERIEPDADHGMVAEDLKSDRPKVAPPAGDIGFGPAWPKSAKQAFAAAEIRPLQKRSAAPQRW